MFVSWNKQILLHETHCFEVMHQQKQTDAPKAGNTSCPQSSFSLGKRGEGLLVIIWTDITAQRPSQHQTNTHEAK